MYDGPPPISSTPFTFRLPSQRITHLCEYAVRDPPTGIETTIAATLPGSSKPRRSASTDGFPPRPSTLIRNSCTPALRPVTTPTW